MDTNIIIEEKDLALAQTLCASISDTENHNRAIANILGTAIASKYFDPDVYNIDIENSLCKIPKVNEEFNISDLYVNNTYVDVRVYFNEEELCVPKLHFDNGILPEAYMFIKLSTNLSEGTVTGFITPKNIDTDNPKNDSYYLKEENLNSIYDIESLFINKLDTAELSDDDVFSYLEDSLDYGKKIEFIKTLISSVSSRRIFTRIANAQDILKKVSDYDTDSINENKKPDENIDSLFNSTEADSIEESFLNDFDYKTEVTPSSSELIEEVDNEFGNLIENENNEEPIQEEPTNTEEFESETKIDTTELETETEISEEENKEIGKLFADEENIRTLDEGDNTPQIKKKSYSGLLTILILAFALCGGGYWWYSNNNTQTPADGEVLNQVPAVANEDIQTGQNTSDTSAMPNETVNANIDTNINNNEAGASISIPEIEKNLDASVLVSNLKVDWEVPSSYVSNAYARRYLIKLGKIIQLNLKTELLLLSKPPISNKITVEIKYNPSRNRFEPLSIIDSSGEKTVDNTIMNTVDTVLKMNISTNFESFGKLQGNPVLIIHL